MSQELMSRFLEGLHASRLLDNDRIEELLRRPEPPQGDMDGVGRFLEGNGWLTRFQIDEIREGRGTALTFAGYRLLERLPDIPSGPAYRAFHPALQKSVVLRWLNRDWIEPHDNFSAYIERAQAASVLSHPYILATLDAGIVNDRPFLVQELIDSANLEFLVKDMGALPVPLACEYIRQTATALQAGADRGIYHGDLAPSRLQLTPIVRKPGANGDGKNSTRPAPGASVRVCELGLMPTRPPLGAIPIMHLSLLCEYSFAAPERLTQSVRNAKSDIWSLGASLYYLLAGRPPFSTASPTESLQQLQYAEPLRVDKLRNDVPAPLADYLHRTLSRDSGLRPETAGAIAQFLSGFCQYGSAPAARLIAAPSVPLASETLTIPVARPVLELPAEDLPLAEALPHIEPLPAETSDSRIVSPIAVPPEPLPLSHDDHHDLFAGHHGDAPLKQRTQKEKKRNWTWLILGGALHLVALTVLILWFAGIGPFDRSPSTSSSSDKSNENTPSNVPKLGKKATTLQK